jgi:flagellar biosynthesis protein FlhG
VDKWENIAAILGPKGGVGKSTISANLAIALSRMGKRVVAVDLDLGASNLHAILGMRESPKGLSDFIQNRVKNLADVILNTSIGELGVICGGDDPGIANMPYQTKMKLIRHLSALDYDLILLDLAPGTSHNVVDFSIIAGQALLITTAEVPSLLNVYTFIKSVLFRRLFFFFKYKKSFELMELLDKARESDKHPHLKTMEGFFQEARKTDSAVAESARKMLTRLKPFVVVNRVRTEKDAKAGQVMKNLLKEYLNIETTRIMTIREDDAVGNAIAKLSPIMIDAPNSPFSNDIKEIAARLC